MNIKFINHACFSITDNDEMILFDPWFTGAVFNESWRLLKDTNIEDLDLSKLSTILITHEHPDHLHWTTLRQIKEKCENKIRIVFPKRSNKNVVDNLVKLGFIVAEMPPNKLFKMSPNFSVANFPSGHDSAYVVKAGDKTILNQNDCKLSIEQCNLIKQMCGEIDAYFMQFSLAGYYANRDDNDGLQRAKVEHVNMLTNYSQIFNPKITIPFASFIYFSRERNRFLNDWIVDLGEIPIETQVLYYGDELVWNRDTNRTDLNKSLWKSLFSESKLVEESRVINKEEIVDSANKFFKQIASQHTPPATAFDLFDLDCKILINYKDKQVKFVKNTDAPTVGKVTSFDINNFFKFPWGADTLNITSCFDIYDKPLWKANLIFRDSQYRR